MANVFLHWLLVYRTLRTYYAYAVRVFVYAVLLSVCVCVCLFGLVLCLFVDGFVGVSRM